MEEAQRAALQAAFEEVQQRIQQEAKTLAQPQALKEALRTTLEDSDVRMKTIEEGGGVPSAGAALSPQAESLKSAMTAAMQDLIRDVKTPEEQRQMLKAALQTVLEEKGKKDTAPPLPQRIELPSAVPEADLLDRVRPAVDRAADATVKAPADPAP
jgi:predicted RNase H-like HicB family nuclease